MKSVTRIGAELHRKGAEMLGSFGGWVTAKINRRIYKYHKKQQIKYFFKQKAEEYRNDRNFDAALVDKCFSDCRKQNDDGEILSRIATAYNKSKQAQKIMPSYYQVGNEWLPIYEKSLQHIMRALEHKDINAIRASYQNYWRDSCSTGLVGLPVNMERYYFGGRIPRKYKRLHLFSSLHRIKLWKNLLGKNASLADLSAPAIGNPYYYSIDGQLIKAGSDYLHYYASTIGRLTDADRRRVIVEIGGGYGGMAYYLLRDQSNLAYVDFDLPENMALSAYYLLNAFPEKKAVLYGEEELSAQCVARNDLIIMPNFEMDKLQNDSVDLVFNSYSLAEMSPETINNYVQTIMRVTNKYFYHVNHTRHSLVTADEFGIDPKMFKLLYKLPALWNAGINPDMDEYEYLYEKRLYETHQEAH